MNTTVKKVIATIQLQKHISNNDRILVAVSGGADSVALLDILVYLTKKFNLSLAIAHYDHGLREDSFKEALFVAKLAQKYKIPFYISCENLLKYSSYSIEERARNMRYQFLQKSAEKFKATCVAVAHHANDQGETLLLNLMRGSGIIGIAGIPYQRSISPQSPILVVRPLLDVKKDEILHYLNQKKLPWVEDISNKDIHFERNKIREVLLPFIQEQFDRDIISSLHRTSQRCREINNFMQEQAEEMYKQAYIDLCGKKNIKSILASQEIFVEAFNSEVFTQFSKSIMPFFIKKTMQEIGENISIRSHHYQMIEKLKEQNGGEISFSDNVKMLKKSDKIYIYNVKNNNDWQKQINCESSITMQNLIFHLSSTDKPNCLQTQKFDAKKVIFPLYIRNWNDSDSMKPLGLKGKKSIRKILKDIKLYQPFRDFIPLVVDSKNMPIWLLGICVDHRVRISTKTSKIMYLSICKR